MLSNRQESLEILQKSLPSSNYHSCIPQTISSVSRGTHCWFQESHGKTELQTYSANWELSNFGGIWIYGRRCLHVALCTVPRWISQQAVIPYRAACFSSSACSSVLWVCFTPLIQLHATLLIRCSHKLLAEGKEENLVSFAKWLKTESWTYPYFKKFIPVMLKRNHTLKLERPSSSGVRHLSPFCQHSLEVALVFLWSQGLQLCQLSALHSKAVSRARGPDLNRS